MQRDKVKCNTGFGKEDQLDSVHFKLTSFQKILNNTQAQIVFLVIAQ